MAGPRILVVYYSRSGTTRKIAETLSEALCCDLEQIVEAKSRTGFFGYMRSLVEARQKRPSVIAPTKRDASSYDLVVVGTPVWGWSVSSPVRAYLLANRDRLPETAFFCTLGGAGGANAFAPMQDITGKVPRALCAITVREVKSGSYRERASAFAKVLEPSVTEAHCSRGLQ